MLQVATDRVDGGVKARPDKEQPCLSVVDDIGDLCRCEPPSDWYHYDSDSSRAEEELVVQVTILAEPGNPVSLLESRSDQGRGHLCRPLFQFAESQGAIILPQCQLFRAIGCPMRNEMIETQQWRRGCLDLGHLSLS